MNKLSSVQSAARSRFSLENGLRVVVEEDHTTPAVAVNLWYNVGSRHDETGRTGLAHLFEHLMFQGSVNTAPGEYFALLDGLGAGELNATTFFDRTNYYATVPTEALEMVLWLEADRMGGLLSALDQESLDNERDVVRNERRQLIDNQPYGSAWETLFANTFARGHQYHHTAIGWMDDLSKASLQDVRDFFIRHYTPSNAVLSLVGDIDPETARAKVERYFGGIAAGIAEPAPAPQPEEYVSGGKRIDVIDEEVPAPMVFMAWPVPVDGTDAANQLELAGRLLGGSESSRLSRELIRRSQLAISIAARLERLVGGRSMFTLVAEGREGVQPQQLVDVFLSVIRSLGAEKPTDGEVEAALAHFETDFLVARQTLFGRADSLSHGLCLFDDPDYDDLTLKALRTVTAAEISAAVRSYLRPECATVLTYTPPVSNTQDGATNR